MEMNMARHTVSAMLAVALCVMGGRGTAAAQQPERRPVLAVLDFTNSSLQDHELYHPFSVGIAGMLLSELRRNPNIELVERERLRQVLEEIEFNATDRVDAATAARAGRILGAHHMLFGVFVIDRRGNLRLDARAVSVETSRVEHVETVEDDADNLLRAVRQLGSQLTQSLRLPAPPSDRPSEDVESAQRGQMLANMKYARAMLEEDRDNVERAVELYCEFLSDSPPGYALALRGEAEQRVNELTGTCPTSASPEQSRQGRIPTQR
jgi:TolB-like protein